MFKNCCKYVLYISYQALHAGYMVGVYRDRIVKTVLGIRKVLSDFENAATLQRKQERETKVGNSSPIREMLFGFRHNSLALH